MTLWCVNPACKKPIIPDNKFIQCSKCKQRYHENCANVIGVFQDGSIKNCIGCKNNRMSGNRLSGNASQNSNPKSIEELWLKIDNLLTQNTSILTDKIDNIETSLANQIKQANDNIQQLSDNFQNSLSRIDSLETEVEEISKKIQNAEQVKLQDSIEANETMLLEFKDRQNREKNIILHNMQESDNTDEDIDKVKEILKECPFDIAKLKVFRLGKNIIPNKIRPIKVIFENTETALWCKINKNSFCINDLDCKSDLTNQQRDYFKLVYKEFERRKNDCNENDISVKLINGKLTIVKNKVNGSKFNRKQLNTDNKANTRGQNQRERNQNRNQEAKH